MKVKIYCGLHDLPLVNIGTAASLTLILQPVGTRWEFDLSGMDCVQNDKLNGCVQHYKIEVR